MVSGIAGRGGCCPGCGRPASVAAMRYRAISFDSIAGRGYAADMLRVDATLFEPERDLVALAVARLRQFEPPEGYYLAFGGGKDSVVLEWLARRAGVRFDAHFSLTTIDPPELVAFVRGEYPGVAVERPPRSFFNLFPERGAPRRQTRWCCQALKEVGGAGRVVLTGVRWAESYRRRRRMMVEVCNRSSLKRYVHPMIDWSTPQVWALIRTVGLPYCSLYDEGFTRLGCIACPMQTSAQRWREMRRWPKYELAFRLAFRRLHERRTVEGNASVARWKDGEAMFRWWMSNRSVVQGEEFHFD
jgi:phosphoadenosine phosphosulfate reductase